MRFIDNYFYAPNLAQKIIIFALLPISFLYFLVATARRKCSIYRDFNIPIISIGNLIAGGSGKTPFLLEIAKKYEHIAIISRGYKRKSKGLIIVSNNGKILCDVKQCGDEAFMLAVELKNASVIVSENRVKGILEAKKLGAKIIFLDDGFRFNFKKLNIILSPKLEPYYKFCLPSGIYRENPFYKNARDLRLKEGLDYKRRVEIINESERMLLVTAIANAGRLREFLGKNIVGEIILGDHANFDLEALEREFRAKNATSILVTKKDLVKLANCKLEISQLVLKMEINNEILLNIDNYIKENLA